VVVELDGGGGLCLYATLSEDVAAKDDALRGFEIGAKVRIVVYDNANAYVTEALGTASYSMFTLDGGESLDVPVGTGYTFVAYSFNSAVDPPARPSDDVLRGVASPSDLLYGKSGAVNIVAGDNAVTIPMAHMFSQVRLAAATTSGLPGNITAMEADLFPSYAVDLPLFNAGAATGVPSPVAASEAAQGFTFPGSLNAAAVESRPMAVFTNNTNPIDVVINSVSITGVNGGNPLSSGYMSFPFALDLGTSYTLTVSLSMSSTGPWAGSNIYWDGERLTFDAMGRTEHSLYSGVLFRWGSLVGISPSEYWDNTTPTSSTVATYIPTYNSGNVMASTWRSGPFNAEIGAWTDMPLITPPNSDLPLVAYLYDNSTPTSYGEMKGDICRYIGDTGAGPRGYRMPKTGEFNLDGLAFGIGGYGWPDGSYTPTYTGNYWERVGNFDDIRGTWLGSARADGTTPFVDHIILHLSSTIKVIFPVSSRRSSYTPMGLTDGLLEIAGSQVNYWCGSPQASNMAYFVSATDTHLWTNYSFSILYAVPIRCIKN
jgi:hypothetical protein